MQSIRRKYAHVSDMSDPTYFCTIGIVSLTIFSPGISSDHDLFIRGRFLERKGALDRSLLVEIRGKDARGSLRGDTVGGLQG
jgi:hypothetical protein